MTAPTPDDQRAAADKAKAKSSTSVEPLTVVEYTHHDPILGREHRDVGVVFEVGENALKVVPLAHHSVQVDPADVVPLSADDV